DPGQVHPMPVVALVDMVVLLVDPLREAVVFHRVVGPRAALVGRVDDHKAVATWALRRRLGLRGRLRSGWHGRGGGGRCLYSLDRLPSAVMSHLSAPAAPTDRL